MDVLYVYCFKLVGCYKHKLSRIESLVILYWEITCLTRRRDDHEIIWIVEIPNNSAPCTPRRADICQDLGVADVMYLSLSLSLVCIYIFCSVQ